MPYDLTRQSRIRLYTLCNERRGDVAFAIDLPASRLSTAGFERAKEIFATLTHHVSPADAAADAGSYGYYVEAGPQDACVLGMKTVFNGGPFSLTPKSVIELHRLLAAEAQPGDFGLKQERLPEFTPLARQKTPAHD